MIRFNLTWKHVQEGETGKYCNEKYMLYCGSQRLGALLKLPKECTITWGGGKWKTSSVFRLPRELGSGQRFTDDEVPQVRANFENAIIEQLQKLDMSACD